MGPALVVGWEVGPALAVGWEVGSGFGVQGLITQVSQGKLSEQWDSGEICEIFHLIKCSISGGRS